MADISKITLPDNTTVDIKDSTARASLNGKVDIAGDTMTGALIAPSFQTGSTASNYFQSRKFRGEGAADTYYHAIDFGYSGHNQVDFYEYGGVWNFHKHTAAAVGSGDTLVGKISSNGWEGSATLTGTPTAPTAAAGTNNTQIATTAFVKTAIDNAGGSGKTLVFTNKTVAASAWSTNSDLDYYGYRASIALSGVTASMMPQVTFTDLQVADYDLAPVCQSYAGGVYIYSAEAISEAITIPSIGLIGG